MDTLWTDEFLAAKRPLADPDYDKRAEAILGATYLDDTTAGILNDWLAAQRVLISDVERAGDAVIDGLRMRQKAQHEGLGAWRKQVWPMEGWQSLVESTYTASLLASRALVNREPKLALSAMRCALEYGQLLAAKVARVKAGSEDLALLREFSAQLNRGAYYRLLQISEDVRRAPDVFVCDRAFRKAQFRSYPDTLHDSFTPPHCPHWVDEKKLKMGFELWRDHMPGCVFALFTYSLPACYLDAKGIPLLYRTARLREQQFLAHRIYETGFFVKDVMDEGGLTVIEDHAALHVLLFAAAVHKVRPELTLELSGVGLDPMWLSACEGPLDYRTLAQDAVIKAEYASLQAQYAKSPQSVLAMYEPPAAEALERLGIKDLEELLSDCAHPRVELVVRRLWGAGVLTATKVRYLHSSMRYMARSDAEFRKRYPIETHGEPINQEDKALTLLTISYVIPTAYEKIGGILSDEQKEAFLHCWNVIGYVMGVDEDLLPRDWAAAKALYEKIIERHKAASENGATLTTALCQLIAGLLPVWLPQREAVAPVLIRHQLGDDADLLFDAKTRAASRSLPIRAAWQVARVFLRIYFVSRYLVFDHVPLVRTLLRDELRSLGDGMIKCFQQSYERERFDFFSGVKGYDANPATTPAADAQRAEIRGRAYNVAWGGVALIVLLPAFLWISAVAFLASYIVDGWPRQLANVMLWLCVADVLGVGLVANRLKSAIDKLSYTAAPRALG